MGRLFYTAANAVWAVPRLACIRELVIGAERAQMKGPFILAVSHLSHLEPVFVGAVVRRHVRWMARVEHYRHPIGSALLNLCGSFSVDRFGNSGPAIRTAVRLLNAGEVVGIFPEGGVSTGPASALRGGSIKGGACTISIATGAPVVPVVVLGTHALNCVGPWLPAKRGRVWMAFGESISPRRRTNQSRRQLRREMALRIQSAFVETFDGLLQKADLREQDFP
jgi:1-acyl-sn-glycerol-3-phosphate acyltransferase